MYIVQSVIPATIYRSHISALFRIYMGFLSGMKKKNQLDPVGLTMRCEMMRLYPGSVKSSNCRFLVVLGLHRRYWVSLGPICLHILKIVEIWSGVTNASQTDRETLKDRATQLLRSGSGALVTQFPKGRHAMNAVRSKMYTSKTPDASHKNI